MEEHLEESTASDSKARFLHAPAPPKLRSGFALFETMLWNDGILLEKSHLERMAVSATHFGWRFDQGAAEQLLASQGAGCSQGVRHQIVLRLTPDGRLTVTCNRLRYGRRFGIVKMAAEATAANDPLRQHQTTSRELYDRLAPKAREQGLDDFLFANDRGELTEGAVYSVFVKRGKKLLTPPLACGVLPGVYRRHVLETNSSAQEEILDPADLQNAEAVYLSNSLIGMVPVSVIQ